MRKLVLLLFSSLALSVAGPLNYGDILFVIQTQTHPYHISLSERLKDDIITQADSSYFKPKVLVSGTKGSWTVLPIFSVIVKKYQSQVKWVVFCDDHIVVRLQNVVDTLEAFDHNSELWVGHSLRDVEPTIIHHFHFSENGHPLVYPNYASGFAMSMPLVKTSHKRFVLNETVFQSDFSIDPAFELALFLWNNGTGSALKSSPSFCVVSSDECATYPGTYSACRGPVSLDTIFFAVKTCHKFHADRIPVVKKTWGRFASNIMYFSDKEDLSIPTTYLDVPNTEKGHCGKTIGILNYLAKHLENYPKIKWVVLADDDTILSVSRICEIVSCYGVKDLALGERYGYNILNGKGYDYLTGGGGLILSMDIVKKLANCTCPSISSPDDMWIGVCMAKLKIPVIHSPLFHQGRPIDYTLEHLAPHRPVSFHRHWMVDPVEVYREWFENDDSRFIQKSASKNIVHNEL